MTHFLMGTGFAIPAVWLWGVLIFGLESTLPDWFPWGMGHPHDMDLAFYASVLSIGAVAGLVVGVLEKRGY